MEASSTYIVLKELAGNAPPAYNAIQLMLLPHISALISAWQAIWAVTLVTVAWIYVRGWLIRRRAL